MKKNAVVPIEFPDEVETIRRESEKYDAMSATDRFLAIVELMRFGKSTGIFDRY